jgi:Tol biopolymer transport system component
MKKIRLFLVFLALISGIRSFAQNSDHLLWMQQPAISPDGQWIAFEYKGNIYKVPATGGNAVPLTMNSWYNGYPKWSHDGSQLAFASDRYGNFDVFTIPATGGTASRLTYSSTRDIPTDFSGDGKLVYYMTNTPDVYTSMRFPDPDNLWQKLFAIPVQGGRARLINSAGTEFASFNKDGDKLIFQDRKGWENPYRKHHVSPVTRNIWCYDLKSKSYSNLTDFAGEDREPVWGAGDQFYYLSERSGNLNIFTASVVSPDKVTQLTGFEKDPVRNLTISGNGLLAFTQNGELYTLKEGELPKKLTVTLAADFGDEQISNASVKSAGDEMSVSPNGSAIAFVFQGDIFVTNSAGTITRQITNTPEQERMVSFSPDGRTLLYSVENAGSWDIYQAALAGPAEKSFYGTGKINFSAVIATGKDEYQGVFSPDGKRIAYMEERSLLKVYDVASKKTLTLVPGGVTFSFQDGDMPFYWSSDGKYIAFQTENGLQGRVDVDLVKSDGSEKAKNVTLGAYLSWQPHWGASGKMIYYLSGKEGSGGQRDVYALFFDHAAFKNYVKSAEDPLLQTEKKRLDSLAIPAKKNAAADKSIIPNTLHPEDQTVKLTSFSSQLGDFVLAPDERKLYAISTVGENSGIWIFNQQTHESSVLAKLENGGGKLAISIDGKWLYLLAGGKLAKINTADGQNLPIRIDGNQFFNKSEQRKYILEHVYHLLTKKFTTLN